MNQEIGLSSGCFTNMESLLASSGVETIELSSHNINRFPLIRKAITEANINVLSVHCPSPSEGLGINLAATGDKWTENKNVLLTAFKTASEFNAKYIIAHAFYCIDALPSNDIDRMKALREFSNAAESVDQYVTSKRYLDARERAKTNIKNIINELRKKFPNQKLIIENLNPRVGYGGIRIEDIRYITEGVEDDVGICLDIGHLELANSALGRDMSNEIHKIKDNIKSCHIHQNFGGRYAIDEYWNEGATSKRKLQEVDTHLPLLSKYKIGKQIETNEITEDNSAFRELLANSVYYSADDEDFVTGTVPVEDIMKMVPSDANRILEYDSRFAPLENIIWEYNLFKRNKHPVKI